ncbi:MAG: GTP cyclohydrolase FolE2 [Lysobacterales bacterium]
MRPADATLRALPDVALQAGAVAAAALEWVGMEEIEVPVQLSTPAGVTQVPARVHAFVNLSQPAARGIHMSRLYLHLDRHLGSEVLTPRALHGILRDFLDSHVGLSDRALLRLRFDQMLRRPALVSDTQGWRRYPVTVTAIQERGHFSLELALEVLYSSTCPCSAALARQLIQEQFDRDFGAGAIDRAELRAWLGSEQGIVATPHAQRSRLQLRARLLPSFAELPIVDLVDILEHALQTPVQTAVKREDEQAFARLNGANLMFCEDAARRARAALVQDGRLADFWLRAVHQESLHPHDAVAIASKGVAGGYGPHTEWV